MADDINEKNDGLSDDNEELPTESGKDTSTTPVDNEGASTQTETNNRNEEANSISADLIRGHINTIILRALYERDKYGYEIINDIESKSHGQYTLKQPTLYSALKRLENQGYIKAYWKTDEVTLGGRRKYFTLTDSGKVITEKNLSEWEYSRTIIDSLISDKSFDFNRPAPTPIDFTLLRDSVSRVPTVRSDERPVNENNQNAVAEPTAQQIISQHPTETVDSISCVQTVEYVQAIGKTDENKQPEASQEQAATAAEKQPEAVGQPNALQEQATASAEKTEEPVAQSNVLQEQTATNIEKPAEPSTQPEKAQGEQVESADEAARRRTHENYLRLISEPVHTKPIVTEDIVPGSDNINSDKLMYNNRPETERDYKNLIDGIFYKTVYNGSVQTNYHSKQAERTQHTQSRRAANTARLVERGANDGVSITPSNEANASHATKTTYNKGLTMLKSSSVVLAFLVIEAIICFAFMKTLEVSWVYPTVILAIGVVQFAIFGILTLNGYGRNCVRPTGNGYISSCIILTIISILIIATLSFLLNMNTAVASDVLTMLVIPSITAVNITIFAVCFKLFLN